MACRSAGTEVLIHGSERSRPLPCRAQPVSVSIRDRSGWRDTPASIHPWVAARSRRALAQRGKAMQYLRKMLTVIGPVVLLVWVYGAMAQQHSGETQNGVSVHRGGATMEEQRALQKEVEQNPNARVNCGTYSCPSGLQCMTNGSCAPRGSADCGTYSCPPGQQCTSDRHCAPAGTADCGNGHYCRQGQQCLSNGTCAPAGSVDCGDGGYCNLGFVCMRGGCGLCDPRSCMVVQRDFGRR